MSAQTKASAAGATGPAPKVRHSRVCWSSPIAARVRVKSTTDSNIPFPPPLLKSEKAPVTGYISFSASVREALKLENPEIANKVTALVR